MEIPISFRDDAPCDDVRGQPRLCDGRNPRRLFRCQRPYYRREYPVIHPIYAQFLLSPSHRIAQVSNMIQSMTAAAERVLPFWKKKRRLRIRMHQCLPEQKTFKVRSPLTTCVLVITRTMSLFKISAQKYKRSKNRHCGAHWCRQNNTSKTIDAILRHRQRYHHHRRPFHLRF